MTLLEVLGGEREAAGAFRFTIGRELHGAYGGAFGGAVAASTLVAARDIAPGRVPASLDIRFLRGLPAGTASVDAALVHGGRSLSVVSVDVAGPDGRLCARSTISLANLEALHPLDAQRTGVEPLPLTYDDAPPWQQVPGREIPMLTTLAPRVIGRVGAGIAAALRVPWTPDETSGAEAGCFAADLCTGPPVAFACAENWVPHPNPDLTLRFAGPAPVSTEIVGIGTAARIAGGVAAVSIDVRCAGAVVAVGAATSILLAVEGGPK